MSGKKTIGVLFLVGGLALFFISIYGYPLGIAQRETFGALQWLGTLVGATYTVYGVIKLMRKNK